MDIKFIVARNVCMLEILEDCAEISDDIGRI